jgi:hypothetical protein
MDNPLRACQESKKPRLEPIMNADTWNQRFGADHYLYGTEPNAYLRSQGWRFDPGAEALVLADGEGRNGVWLATQGLKVLSVDQSSVGLAKAERLAAERGTAIRTETADLARWGWPVASFDLAVLIFAHFPSAIRPTIHRHAAAALRPGGLLLLEAFRPAQIGRTSGGPKDTDLLYTPAALAADVAGMEILELLEGTVSLDEGALHRGEGEVVRLLARRPV